MWVIDKRPATSRQRSNKPCGNYPTSGQETGLSGPATNPAALGAASVPYGTRSCSALGVLSPDPGLWAGFPARPLRLQGRH
jgi:hypothetical protein